MPLSPKQAIAIPREGGLKEGMLHPGWAWTMIFDRYGHQLGADLENDIDILEDWRDGARSVSRDEDEKLHRLREALHDVVERAQDDAEAGEVDEEGIEAAFRRNRKVLLFSY